MNPPKTFGPDFSGDKNVKLCKLSFPGLYYPPNFMDISGNLELTVGFSKPILLGIDPNLSGPGTFSRFSGSDLRMVVRV